MIGKFWAGCFMTLLAAVPLSDAHSASETVLYPFCSQTNCTDGASPFSTLIADGSGNFYGTTYAGGANNDGEVFKLASDGTLTVLHSFAGSDGASPRAGVIMDANGNLYGTTAGGGTGQGTVFEVASDGTFSMLHEFDGRDGDLPYAGLLMDSSGNLYGTTASGGANDVGEVFEFAPSGVLSVLYSFCSVYGCPDGAEPWAPLIMDSGGNLYGTAIAGGLRNCRLGCGTVFKLGSDGKEKTLYSFEGSRDGASPISAVTFDGSKNLVGTASGGGTHGNGTAFTLHGSNFHLLHEFHGNGDAKVPYAALISDGNGGYYGTACVGAAHQDGGVFHVAPNGSETIVYSFKGGSDGQCPESSLLEVDGTLYGTTRQGGGAGCSQGYGCGTVFAIEP